MPLDTSGNAEQINRVLVEGRLEAAQTSEPTVIVVDNSEWIDDTDIRKTPYTEFMFERWNIPERSPREIKILLDPEPGFGLPEDFEDPPTPPEPEPEP